MEKKKVKLFSVVALVTLALLVVGATYAYFQNQYGDASNADVKVMTYTTDVLTFETGDAINISADQETFAEGKGNQTGSTFAKATLQANNKTNTATANYYIYLNIENNTFTYTNTGTPELILQVVDKTSGNPVTSITGLDYVTVTDGKNTSISGFDITNKKGLIALFSNKEISASPKTVEEYTVAITLVNHSFDQNNNAGKNLSGKLIIQKDEYILTVTDVCSGKSLSDCVIAQYTGINNSNIYYHDGTIKDSDGNIIDAEDNSYRFAGANPNNYVCFGSDDATCPTENLYRIIGLIDGKIKLISADGATTDMFGTDGDYAMTYQEGWADHTANYKGSADLTKMGSYKWNSTVKNTWSTSVFNTANLNTNFLTYLDGKNAKWKTMIVNTTWYVGGISPDWIYSSNAKTVYNYEVGINKNTYTTVTSKIGLMYISEYYYGATPNYWTLPGRDAKGSINSDYTVWSGNDYSKAINDNWMNTGLYEWTLSRRSDASSYAFVVHYLGHVSDNYVHNGFAVRPSFNLTSSVQYDSGLGTSSDPIRLKN